MFCCINSFLPLVRGCLDAVRSINECAHKGNPFFDAGLAVEDLSVLVNGITDCFVTGSGKLAPEICNACSKLKLSVLVDVKQLNNSPHP